MPVGLEKATVGQPQNSKSLFSLHYKRLRERGFSGIENSPNTIVARTYKSSRYALVGKLTGNDKKVKEDKN